jgi:DNA-binding NarL/FixJ family response regulator
MSEQKITVMLVEDDPDFIYLAEKMIQSDPEINYAGHATNYLEAINLAYTKNPTIVLLDLSLTFGELDGIEVARKIRCQTNAKILIVTSFEDYDTVINACMKSFASGYIFKSQFDTLLQTVKYTARGNTPQEHLIRSLILNQLSDAEKVVLMKMKGDKISLNSSSKTIANQKTSILKKLGLKNQKVISHLFR